jgi:hypothetical protein
MGVTPFSNCVHVVTKEREADVIEVEFPQAA